MKKLACLILCLLLCLCAAAAETAPETGHAFTTETETIDQDCFVHVQLIFEQPSGETQELVLSLKAFTARYTFDVYTDADGSYTGFSYDPENVVALINNPPEGASPFLSLLDLTAEIKEVPRNYSFSGRPDDFFLQLSGGMIELNYNRVLHFNFLGELIEATPVTENRAFYYSTIPVHVVTDAE